MRHNYSPRLNQPNPVEAHIGNSTTNIALCTVQKFGKKLTRIERKEHREFM